MSIIEDFLQNLLQPGIVDSKAAAGRLDHLLPRDPAPVDGQSAANGELSNELALGPPVSFAERMDGIDFTEVISASRGEAFQVAPRKMPPRFSSLQMVSRHVPMCWWNAKGSPDFEMFTVRNSPAHSNTS
jgi:hypothetical protein